MIRPMENIHDLFSQVREHPDFAGGTVFVRDDVADALHIQAHEITDEQMYEARKAIENYIFNGAYSWTDALRDCLPGPV